MLECGWNRIRILIMIQRNLYSRGVKLKNAFYTKNWKLYFLACIYRVYEMVCDIRRLHITMPWVKMRLCRQTRWEILRGCWRSTIPVWYQNQEQRRFIRYYRSRASVKKKRGFPTLAYLNLLKDSNSRLLTFCHQCTPDFSPTAFACRTLFANTFKLCCCHNFVFSQDVIHKHFWIYNLTHRNNLLKSIIGQCYITTYRVQEKKYQTSAVYT